jgi:HK97 family phage major capsid protein
MTMMKMKGDLMADRSFNLDRASESFRTEFRAALAGLKVGERIRVGDVMGALPSSQPTEGERAEQPAVVQFLGSRIGREAIDEEARSVGLSFSSEQPYERWWGVEVLGHNSGEMDVSWIGSGRAPFLADHDTKQQIGVVLSAELGADRRGLAGVRFGKSARAQQEWQDVLDGVRVNVSVGYEIRELELVKQEGEVKTYRVTDWQPLEVSLVSIPADMTVGVGREGGLELNPPAVVPAAAKPVQVKEKAMPEITAGDITIAETAAREAALKTERERCSGILELGTRHQMRQIAEEHIAKGTALELFRGLMLDELHKRGSDKPLQNPVGQLDLSKREVAQFSVARYMRSLIDKDVALAPFEHECAKAVREAMDKAGYRGQGKGNFLPYDLMTAQLPGVRVENGNLVVGDRVIGAQRDLATTPVGAGGAMVATDLLSADFITLLRNASMVRRMGARVLGGLVGNVAIPRQTGTVTMGWVAQAGAATESDAVFAQVTMSPKTAHGIQDVTRDLLLQGTPAVEGLVRADLIEAMATQLDFIALHGTGASNQPTGLAATAGIGSVAGGTNGLAPTWDHIVDLESQVANNNAAVAAVGYLTNTRVRGRLKRTQKFASTNGQEIWMPPMAGQEAALYGSLNGYSAGVSNNVRNDLVKGSSGAVCSAIFFGNWNDLLIGEWGTAEILPDEVTQAANRIVRMHVYQTIDIAVRRGQSFAAMLDALTV